MVILHEILLHKPRLFIDLLLFDERITNVLSLLLKMWVDCEGILVCTYDNTTYLECF